MGKRKTKAETSPPPKVKKSTQHQPPTKYSKWLMKSEPESRLENGVDVKFGLEDLKKMENQTSCWDGVRNYQVKIVEWQIFGTL